MRLVAIFATLITLTLKPWSSRLVLDWLLASTRLLFLGGEVLEGPIPVSGPVLRGSGVVISS